MYLRFLGKNTNKRIHDRTARRCFNGAGPFAAGAKLNDGKTAGLNSGFNREVSPWETALCKSIVQHSLVKLPKSKHSCEMKLD